MLDVCTNSLNINIITPPQTANNKLNLPLTFYPPH